LSLINKLHNFSCENFVLAEVTNALYNVSYDADTQKVIVQRKSQQEQEQEIEQAGGNQNAFNVVEAFTSSTDMGSEAANNVAEVINQLAQTDTYAAVQAVKALAPEEGATRQVVQTVNTNEIFSAMGTHIASVTGSSDVAPRTYALGDNAALYDGGTYSVWAQGLLNKTHKEANSSSGSFTGRSTGIVGGADTRLSDEWLVGLGYAYTHTNMRSTGRHDRILGDNFLAYAQYKPGSFFVQGAFTYGDSKYEEDKNVSGILVDADYHVHSYALNLTTGFEATEWLTPMAGIRYSVLHQEGYKDSSDQRIAAEQNSFFSGLLGAKLQQLYTVGGVRVLPQLHAGVVYDFVSDGVNGRVSLPNGTLYEIQGDRLHRLAAEAGLSFTAWLTEQVEVSCGYEGAFRKDYNSHTGTLKLRYTF
ncbi:MAG: autotransporter outer membrane beta-barrel domain-containing protein, partial [Elusimicrobiaceae bacterium]|nr:autotransporter outer membrane beta-barrel domain-containing protein [Elusimicrobiaceae bacterium]